MTQNIALPGVGESNPTRLSAAIRQLSERLGDYGPLESPVFTGDPQAPTPAPGDNDTSIATTAYVQSELADYATSTDLTGAIAQEVADRDAAIAAAAYTPAAVADGTIQSNISGASAAPAANSISAVLDDLLGTTRGSIAYRNATVWTPLAPGTAGQYLKTNGAGADPAWADVTQPPWTYIFKSSDQSITSSATLTNDSELTVAVDSGQTITFRVVYFLRPAGSYQAAINGPTASFIKVSAATSSGATAVSAYNSPFGSSTATGSAQVIEALGKVTFTASGTFTLRIAQATSNATASVFEAGSYLEYRLS